jgi:hypothetical protein
VSFSSSEIVINILKKKSNQSDKPYKLYKDQTAYQQNQMKTLKAELKQRIENGEKDLGIKFVKGNPKIVNIQPKI